MIRAVKRTAHPWPKQTTTFARDPKAFARPITLIIASICAVIMSWTLYGRADMSLDEGYTFAEAHLPLTDLLAVIWQREMNGSLHTLMSWMLVNSFHVSSVTGIRIVSTVFTIVAVWVTAQIITELHGPQYAPWAALLSASPLVLQQMADARTYALTLMLTAISLRLLLAAQVTGLIARISS